MRDLSKYFDGELQPHQEQAVEWLEATPKALLADFCGAGKTLEAIGLISSLLAKGELVLGRDMIVWTTSAHLMRQTKAELERFLPGLTVLGSDEFLFRPNLYPQHAAQFEALYGTHPDILLISHGKVPNSGPELWNRFPEPSLAIIDEASALKNLDGVKHEAIRELLTDVPRIVAMTASVFENDALETYALLHLLHLPDLWEREEFERQFITWTESYQVGPYAWTKRRPDGLILSELPEFRALLSRYMLRRTSADVGLRLPRQVGPQVRWVPLTPTQQAAYDAAAKVRGGAGHSRRTQAGRTRGGRSTLVDSVLSCVQSEFPNDKVIVACETLAVIEEIDERLDEANIGHRVIEGKIKDKARAEMIREFQTDPNVRVLVGSKVLEVGLNLQVARVLISADCSDNPEREVQRQGRLCRIGSPHATFVHLTLLPDTPTVRKKVASLANKRRNADLLLAHPTAA